MGFGIISTTIFLCIKMQKRVTKCIFSYIVRQNV